MCASPYTLRNLAVQLTCVCSLCDIYEVNYPPWSEVQMSLFSPANGHCLRALSVAVPYTFSVKQKWRTVVLWIFTARSSAVAYLRTSIPLVHSTVDDPGFREDWWRFSNGRVRRSRTAVWNSSFLMYVYRCFAYLYIVRWRV